MAQPDWLKWIDPDAARAEARLKLLYKKLYIYFARRGCQDVEDLAQQAVVRAFEKLAAGAQLTSSFEAFCFGCAQMIARECWRKQKLEHISPDDLPAGKELVVEPAVIEQLEQQERQSCLRQCLRQLAEDERRLFLRYYDAEGQGRARSRARKELAAELGIDEAALRSRVRRLRERLADCLKNCLAKK